MAAAAPCTSASPPLIRNYTCTISSKAYPLQQHLITHKHNTMYTYVWITYLEQDTGFEPAPPVWKTGMLTVEH